MPPKSRVLYCKEFVKTEELKLMVCGERLEGVPPDTPRCPKRAEHMLKYKTGFCALGRCEGTRKVVKDKPQRTCDWWKTCPCNCHKQFDQMFSMSGMTRILVDNSGYSVDHSGFYMPTPEERAAMAVSSNATDTDAPAVIESPLPDAVPVTLARSFGPTVTGRAARGELEFWVKKQCDIWIVEAERWKCTPRYLADQIAKDEGIDPPSVGAIDAVLKRWVKLGFAEIATSPTRFVKYTDEGVRRGLDGMKEKAKRGRRIAAASSARGSLR